MRYKRKQNYKYEVIHINNYKVCNIILLSVRLAVNHFKQVPNKTILAGNQSKFIERKSMQA